MTMSEIMKKILYRKHTFAANTEDDFTHEHHQIVNIKIRLIIFFATKDREALYSEQREDREITAAQIKTPLCQIQT